MPENDVLDASSIRAKFESARRSIEAAPRDLRLDAEVELALHSDIKRIQDYAAANPGDEFVKANQHLLLKGPRHVNRLADVTAGIETWPAGGSVELTGVIYWALGGTVMFAPPLGFLMGATGGPDWAAGAFTSGVAGAFVVDPAKIRDEEMHREDSGIGAVYKGRCRFQLGQGGLGAGGIRISFSSLKGTYWGMLGGVSGGLGGASITGEADLVWS